MVHRTWSVALLTLVLSPAVTAQDWSWPDKLQNLTVLPADWTGQRLRPVMTGFTNALGVRCSHCHVGEEGEPLSTYDFVSDANPNKDRARAMLRMLQTINEELKKIEPSGDTRVNMWCHTCHRGRPRPMTLAEELGEVYRSSGAEAALERYAELKNGFHGLGAYRFDERALNTLGYEALGKDDVAGALAIFLHNTREYPSSANAWDSYAEAELKSGHREGAIRHYRKALEIDPDHSSAKKALAELERKKE